MRKLINLFQIISITIGLTAIGLFLVPKFFKIEPCIVLSGSMEDKIKTGAVAYVNTKVTVDDIQVGDVIAFKIKNGQVTHRVIEKINEDKTFRTKGDANENPDMTPVKFSDYKGKTIFSIPYLGKVLKYCKTRNGKFIMFSLIGLNMVFILFDGEEEKEEKEKEKEPKKLTRHKIM